MSKHDESDNRKNVELAPESEMTVHDKGVARDDVERTIGLLKSLHDESPATRIPYLVRYLYTYRAVFPPTGAARVAVLT